MRTFISIVQDLVTVRTDALRAKILIFSFDRTPTFWAHIGRGQTIGRKMHFLTAIWTDPFFFQFRYHFHTYPLQFYCKAFYCLPLILFKSSVAKCQNENISLHSYYKKQVSDCIYHPTHILMLDTPLYPLVFGFSQTEENRVTCFQIKIAYVGVHIETGT